MMTIEQNLKRIIETHFDPKWGTPYWLEVLPTLGFNPIRDLAGPQDLHRFGPFPLDELGQRPVEYFTPRKYHPQVFRFVTSETGGTTGTPRRTVFLEEEFDQAFVRPFAKAADLYGFPRSVNWLYIGPSGPHIIGKAARACAAALGSMDPFAVDFDPRWIRRLAPDSLARHRYTEHVVEQAMEILRTQRVGAIFATPPILETLGERLDPRIRESVAGIHLGGMAADETFWDRLRGEWFPNAVVLAGYGNSLAGMCPELHYEPGGGPSYFPYGVRLILEVEPVEESADPESATLGMVRFHRLDESVFLPNVVERDVAYPATLNSSFANAGFQTAGIRDPRPPRHAPLELRMGLY